MLGWNHWDETKAEDHEPPNRPAQGRDNDEGGGTGQDKPRPHESGEGKRTVEGMLNFTVCFLALFLLS